MKVNEILTHEPQFIATEAPVVDAAMRMKSFDVGMLPVIEEDRLVGAVTDRDITVRAIADGRDPASVKVRDVMTTEMVYCYEDHDIEEAARLMEIKQVRRLPVLNRNHHLVGIISLGDLAVRTGREDLAGEVLERVSEPTTLGPSSV
jgi:CBS domain-containing protein